MSSSSLLPSKTDGLMPVWGAQPPHLEHHHAALEAKVLRLFDFFWVACASLRLAGVEAQHVALAGLISDRRHPEDGGFVLHLQEERALLAFGVPDAVAAHERDRLGFHQCWYTEQRAEAGVV